MNEVASAVATARHEIQYVARKLYRRSTTNPRQVFDQDAMKELIESVRKKGILQPVLLRPIVDGKIKFELVCGERRDRAAEAAGLEELPAIIREMTDEEALEAQVIENGQRADVHPLEEADAYRALMEKHGRTVDEIGAKVGKSRATVYARLKLCSLAPAARRAFLDDRLNPSTALLVARIPDVKLQEKATEEIAGDRRGEPMSVREASEYIQQSYMLRLEQAPFDISDANLVVKAGACNACPKRTGNQRELFSDVARADVCTDPTCYEEKVDAVWEKRCATAKADGIAVISKTEAKKLFPYQYENSPARDSGFVSADARCYEDSKSRAYRQLLGKGFKADGDRPPPVQRQHLRAARAQGPHAPAQGGGARLREEAREGIDAGELGPEAKIARSGRRSSSGRSTRRRWASAPRSSCSATWPPRRRAARRAEVGDRAPSDRGARIPAPQDRVGR